MGESEFAPNALVSAIQGAIVETARAAEELRINTPGGRFQVRWDEKGSASALGQLAFFAEFLEVSGLFERWRDGCPLGYTSPTHRRWRTCWTRCLPTCVRAWCAATTPLATKG